MSWKIDGRVTEVKRAETDVLDEQSRLTGRTRVYLTAKVVIQGAGFLVHELLLYSYEDDVPLTIGTKVSVTVEEG